MRYNGEAFYLGLRDKHPVEWITMVQRQPFQRVGMVHRDGQPIERLLREYLAECGRNLQFAHGLLDSYLPNDRCAYENQVAAIRNRRAAPSGKRRMVIQPPQENMSVQQ
jgi:hypothetical protein